MTPTNDQNRHANSHHHFAGKSPHKEGRDSVDGSEIRKKNPPEMYQKPVVNNGISPTNPSTGEFSRRISGCHQQFHPKVLKSPGMGFSYTPPEVCRSPNRKHP